MLSYRRFTFFTHDFVKAYRSTVGVPCRRVLLIELFGNSGGPEDEVDIIHCKASSFRADKIFQSTAMT